ncbi:MAG: hypothetical protein HF973_05880 [Chloroflexi bacterium]|nr:hypothetical protein [Chloroflexota bacterium]
MKKVIAAPKAPAPKGAYSQGVVAAAPQLYVSAQGPIDPETGAVVGETFAGQLERALLNVQAVVEAAGATLADVVKVTVFLADWSYFPEMDEIYGRFFPQPYPARTPVKMDIPMGLVMVDAVVALP